MNRLTLAEILGHAERNGLHRLSEGMSAPTAIRVDGRRLTGKSAMLDALAGALAFPDYFGANWDALADCLSDLSWHQGGVALLIDDAATPELRAPEEWGVLLDILADAARHWKDQGRPFAVFLRGGHAAYPLVVA